MWSAKAVNRREVWREEGARSRLAEGLADDGKRILCDGRSWEHAIARIGGRSGGRRARGFAAPEGSGFMLRAFYTLGYFGESLKLPKNEEIAYLSGRMQENAMLLNRIFRKIVPNQCVLRGLFATLLFKFFVKNNVFSKNQKKVKKGHFLPKTMCFTRVFFRI